MNYTTKFSNGDKVFVVSETTFHRIVKCAVCDNTGKIKIKDDDFICPKCNGYAAHQVYGGRRYYVTLKNAIVGQVRLEHEDELKIQYMVDQSGVGSGTIWNECDLFSTLKEAQAFCDKQNCVLLPHETDLPGEPIVPYGRAKL